MTDQGASVPDEHPATAARLPRRRRRWLRPLIAAGALAVLLGVGGYGVAAALGWLPWQAEVDNPRPEAALNDDERAYYDYVSPRVRELAAVTETLREMGAEKSRNIVAIQLHGARLATLVREINGYRADHGTPSRFLAVDRAYREGANLAVEAMGEAQRGFLAFDWDRVAGAVETFDRGTDALDRAVAEIDAATDAEPVPPTATAVPARATVESRGVVVR